MSGDKYFITDQQAPYFVTCTVVHWIDVFTRPIYRDVLVDSLNYCTTEKHVEIFAWVIMSNHLHLVFRCKATGGASAFLRDFKKFTSKKIIELIAESQESRKEWLLDRFGYEARRSGRAENYKLWKDGNHAINLTNIDMMEKINYIHENPVKNNLVSYPEHYIYSSAIDYARGKGLVKVTVI